MRIEEHQSPVPQRSDRAGRPSSRERPVRVLAVELREERVEGRQRVLRELRRRLALRRRRRELRQLGQVGAQRRGPALGPRGEPEVVGEPRVGLQRRRQRRDVAHGEAQRGDLGELLAGQRLAGDVGGGHGAPQRLEGAVDLAHAAALARVGRLAAVLAERLRLAARPLLRLARPRAGRARAQLVLVVIRHRMRAPRDAPRHTPPTHPATFMYTP